MLPVNPDFSKAETKTASSLSLISGSPSGVSCSGEIDHRHARLRLPGGLVLPVQVAKELGRVLVEHGVGDARLPVEVDEVEVAAEHRLHELDPGLLSALLVRQAQVDHLVHAAADAAG